jgi:hypothetical protein
VEWFGLVALVQAVARLSSDILPSSSTAESTADNITKLPNLLQRRTGATPKAVLVGKHSAAEVVAKAQAVLSEAVLLRAIFDVGYFPPNTPPGMSNF